MLHMLYLFLPNQSLPTQAEHTKLYFAVYHHTFPPHPVPPSGVTVPRVTSSQVEYETTAHGSATRVIAGYEVTRFVVPMIGQYVNTGRYKSSSSGSTIQYVIIQH